MFAGNVEQRVRSDLSATLTRLVAVVDPTAPVTTLTEPLQDPRYATPFGGLYWQVVDLDRDQSVASRSLWDFDLRPSLAEIEAGGEPEYLVIPGPADQNLSAMARIILYQIGDQARPYLIVVAEDRAALIASIQQFGTELAIALGILGVMLIGAAVLQVNLGLRPLRIVHSGIESVRSGRERRLSAEVPSEVQPLVDEVNDLLQTQETSIAFARARASDLAHGLKTPLAVMATTATSLRNRGEDDTADRIEELTDEMADKIDYQLKLARLRQRTETHVYTASVNDALKRTIGVLQRTRAGEVLSWQTNIAPDLDVDLDGHDLIELMGVVLENATKWGRTQVQVTAVAEGANIVVLIEDDGPGLSPDEMEAIGVRGERLDETKSGSGLGLAIAKEIVAINHGTIAFEKSGLGGLAVRIALARSG